jgi:hypothetical protein
MRDTILNIRITKGERELIHHAAKLVDRSTTGFIIWIVKKFLKGRKEKTATVETGIRED